MSQLKLKHKMLLLTVIPLVVAIAVVMMLVQIKLTELGEREIEHTRQQMMAAKQETLKNYMDMAYSSVIAIVEEAKDVNDPAVKNR